MKNDLFSSRLNHWFPVFRQALLRGRQWFTVRHIVIFSTVLLMLVVLLFVFHNTQQTRAEPSVDPALAMNDPAVQNPALQVAINEFQRAIELEPDNPDGYRYLSQAYQFADLPDAVVAVWEQAASANRSASWPHLELGAYYEQESRFPEARDAYARALRLAPANERTLLKLARLTSAVSAQAIAREYLQEEGLIAVAEELTGTLQFIPTISPLANGWTLIGYYGDESSLLAGFTTPLWLFWLAPQPGAIAGPAGTGWQALKGGVWLHIEQAANSLLANGAFEASWQDTGPVGFPFDIYLDIYNADPAARQLRVVTRGGADTTVGVLENDIANQFSSLATEQLGVDTRKAYLLTGWFRSWQARVFANVRWRGDIHAPHAASNSIIASDTLARWHRVAGMAEPPPGSTEVQLQLINFESSGQAFFDDVTFIPVTKPGMDSAATRQQLMEAYLAHPAVVEDEAWMTQVAALGPSKIVNQSLENGWTFVGYHTDEVRLAAGEATILWAFWQGPVGVRPGPADEGWYALDVRSWLQIERHASSLLLNGNFEQADSEGAPSGFPLDIYRAEADTHQQVVVERNGLLTAAGLLANSETVTATSFATQDIPIDPSKLYLQTGWIHSQNGNAFMGRDWPDAPPKAGTLSYSFVVARERSGVWRHYAGLATPPEGSTRTQVWLLNNNSTGHVYFDDVTFVPLARPGASATQ